MYVALLTGLLLWWRRSEGTLSVHSITTARRERLYWGTVLLTFGLGTALGDTTAIDMGLGFGWSIALFGVLILVPLLLWRLGLDAVIAFWASYVITRPLGASVADWLGKAPSAGGLGPTRSRSDAAARRAGHRRRATAPSHAGSGLSSCPRGSRGTAVAVGFEPTEGLHPHTLSRRAP